MSDVAANRLVKVETHTGLSYMTVGQTAYDSYLPGGVWRANEMRGLGYPTGGTGGLPGSAPLTLTLTVDPLSNGQVLVQQDADGAQAYLYGLGLIGRFGAQADYWLADGSGSVRQTVNATGTVTVARWYAPFGAVLRETGQDTGLLGYLGMLRQHTSGLLYALGRFYDPADGRFLTRGRWPGNPWLPQTHNPYVPNRGLLDPGLLLLGPLAVLGLARQGRRRLSRRAERAATLLLLVLMFGLVACTCCGISIPIPGLASPPTTPPTGTASTGGASSGSTTPPPPTTPPSQEPPPPCPTPPDGTPPPDQPFDGYVAILACGLESNCPKEVPTIEGQVPLQPIRDSFVQQGGAYIYLGDGAALGSTSAYAGQIMDAMNQPSAWITKGKKLDEASVKGVFLAGHSRGATAVVWAARMGNTSQLKAIAILDSYLLDDGHDLCKSGEYHGCMADGNKVVEAKIPMFMGKSNDTRPDDFPPGTIEPYDTDHMRLAIKKEAANAIINFFLSHK